MWKLALILGASACVFVVLALISKNQQVRKRSFLLLACACAFGAMMLGQFVSPNATVEASLEEFRPLAVGGTGSDPYASSQNCRQCHEEQFDSWHDSYHRTMTQVASTESVIGNFENVQTFAYGREIKLWRRDSEYWVTMDDPEQPLSTNREQIDRPVVMTTGSHHMQVYWYATGKDRRLGQLPVVWLKETQTWVPIHSIFLRPTQTKLGSAEGRWNTTCIKCHTTQGRPRIVQGGKPPVDTHVAEFGIACEACHGPGTQHVDDHLATSMCNPTTLDHRRSAEVCGQCHGVWIAGNPDEANDFMETGLSYRPGDVLSKTRHVFSSEQPVTSHVQAHLSKDPDFMGDRFWPDGMVRVSGREYNGLIRSSCFQKGEMSCVTCHDLHASESKVQANDSANDSANSDWADDQLKTKAETNDVCLECHEQYRSTETLNAHTHHTAKSSGSLCYNCHMPHTTYGLLKAIRSHEISSPSARETVESGRINACNQCHIDQTLAWTSDKLTAWYGHEATDMSEDQRRFSEVLRMGLAGDAGQRALAAWTLGWQPAKQASRSDWAPMVLSQLVGDSYHAVRFLAARSLRGYAGFEEFNFAFPGTDEYAAKRSSEVFQQWNKQKREPDRGLLISTGGTPDLVELEKLRRKRNDRVVVLAE